MIKIIGGILIVAATSWIGFEISRRFSERTRQLRLLKSALLSLEAEIMFGHSPLHEASRKIAKQIDSPIGKIFEYFSINLIKQDTTAKQAWEESLNSVWKQTALKDDDYQILLQFGETLGRHDRIQQQKHIRLAVTHLEREEEEARESQMSYGKMVRNLGFLSGLLIVLLLI